MLIFFIFVLAVRADEFCHIQQNVDPCSFYISCDHGRVSYPPELQRGDGLEALCVHTNGNEDRGTQCLLQCAWVSRSLFSHPIHQGLPVTHCFSQFPFRTCPSPHVYCLTHSLHFFFIILNSISIFSSHPFFCTRLAPVLFVFFQPSWTFYNNIERHMSFLWSCPCLSLTEIKESFRCFAAWLPNVVFSCCLLNVLSCHLLVCCTDVVGLICLVMFLVFMSCGPWLYLRNLTQLLLFIIISVNVFSRQLRRWQSQP